ncbi:Uncharacterised protein [uncultured archaeon]|nr:Uncharacterised protein [uncultured archaeon]
MFIDTLRRMKEAQFFALMALLVAVESILVLVGALPPMMEDNIGHSVFFLLRMAVFISFACTLVGKPLVHTLLKGAVIALAGIVTQVAFIFIGKATGRVLLGVVVPSDLVLYLALLISAAINAVFGAVIVSLSAWILTTLCPKAGTSSKKSRPAKKGRKR